MNDSYTWHGSHWDRESEVRILIRKCWSFEAMISHVSVARRNCSLKSVHISHVPWVELGKNRSVFDHTDLYLLQKVVYLRSHGWSLMYHKYLKPAPGHTTWIANHATKSLGLSIWTPAKSSWCFQEEETELATQTLAAPCLCRYTLVRSPSDYILKISGAIWRFLSS